MAIEFRWVDHASAALESPLPLPLPATVRLGQLAESLGLQPRVAIFDANGLILALLPAYREGDRIVAGPGYIVAAGRAHAASLLAVGDDPGGVDLTIRFDNPDFAAGGVVNVALDMLGDLPEPLRSAALARIPERS